MRGASVSQAGLDHQRKDLLLEHGEPLERVDQTHDHAAHAGVDYDVNSWLALRALANWNMARFAGSVEQEKGHGWGLGADYKVNAHTAVTADYDYDHTQSSRNGTQEAHRVTMGVTVSR